MLIISDKGTDLSYCRGAKQVTWPDITQAWASKMSDGGSNPLISLTSKFSFNVMIWDYDGVFQSVTKSHVISHCADTDKPFPIRDLLTYPLRYAKDGTQELFASRGRKFWDCRYTQFVSYNGWDFGKVEKFRDMRFMIDTVAVKRYQPEAPISKLQLKDELGPEVMGNKKPPSEDFTLLLPYCVMGFNMQDKKWRLLLIENTSPVCWDQDAFKSLVIDDETKELIMALVTNKIDPSKSTDLIGGKGSGLVILFHG